MFLVYSFVFLNTVTYCQHQNSKEAIEEYLELNHKQDSVVLETMTFLNNIGLRNESICDHSNYIHIQIDILEYYTEAIIQILENGNEENISRETKEETRHLVMDRRKRNSVITSLLKTLIQDCNT